MWRIKRLNSSQCFYVLICAGMKVYRGKIYNKIFKKEIKAATLALYTKYK